MSSNKATQIANKLYPRPIHSVIRELAHRVRAWQWRSLWSCNCAWVWIDESWIHLYVLCCWLSLVQEVLKKKEKQLGELSLDETAHTAIMRIHKLANAIYPYHLRLKGRSFRMTNWIIPNICRQNKGVRQTYFDPMKAVGQIALYDTSVSKMEHSYIRYLMDSLPCFAGGML